MQSKRIKRQIGSLVTALVVGWIGTVASAYPIGVTLTPKKFSELFDDTEISIDAPLVTDMSAGSNLKAKVISQAFTDGLGNYAYLYQVTNTGTTGNNVVELFTCHPFFGATSKSTVGYLIDDDPPGEFTLGEQDVIGASVDDEAGPTVSFGFPGWTVPDSYAIDPGESSVTLYVLSPKDPGKITGYLINGATGSGDIVGPVPEPGTIALISVGGLAILLRRRRRQGA